MMSSCSMYAWFCVRCQRPGTPSFHYCKHGICLGEKLLGTSRYGKFAIRYRMIQIILCDIRRETYAAFRGSPVCCSVEIWWYSKMCLIESLYIELIILYVSHCICIYIFQIDILSNQCRTCKESDSNNWSLRSESYLHSNSKLVINPATTFLSVLFTKKI